MRIKNILNEKLGNLSQLNLGKFARLLTMTQHPSKKGNIFRNNSIGPTSEIIDIGQLKKGLPDIRKAFKEYPLGQLFVVYLDGETVIVGVFDDYKLAGKTRTGKIAYDLSQYTEEIATIADEENTSAKTSSWNRIHPIDPSSEWEQEKYLSYDERKAGKQPEKINYIGRLDYDVGSLKRLLDITIRIGQLTGKTITAKIVLQDKESFERMSKRERNRWNDEAEQKNNNLQIRLARFKNAKQPTTDDIHEFIKMVLSKAAKTINFDGVPWSTTGTHNQFDKFSPIDLLNGKSFKIEYKSAEPTSYDKLYLHFSYDQKSNQLSVWKVTITKGSKTKSKIIDLERWLKTMFGINTVDKDTIIRKLLANIKINSNHSKILDSIDVLKSHNYDWPELDIIEKNIKSSK